MNEANISPLARRLAEENSIDWRQLSGSGPGNRVVERDVLMYLARVMSGEAELPGQPDLSEPPPAAGYEVDLKGAGERLAKEGVDLASIIGDEPLPRPPVTDSAVLEMSGPTASAAIEPDDDFEVFELDLDDLDEPVVETEDTEPSFGLEPAPAAYAGAPDAYATPEPARDESAPAAFARSAFEDYASAEPARDEFSQPAFFEPTPDAGFSPSAELEAVSFDLVSPPELAPSEEPAPFEIVPAPASEAATTDPFEVAATAPLPVPSDLEFAAEPQAASELDLEPAEPEEGVPDLEQGTLAHPDPTAFDFEPAPNEVAAHDAALEEVLPEVEAAAPAVEPEPAEAAQPEPVAAPVEAAEPASEPQPVSEPEPVGALEPEPALAPVPFPVVAPVTAAPPRVSPAAPAGQTVLRRSFGAGALLDAQLHLSEALDGLEVPASVFLGRAAGRALPLLGLSTAGLATLGDEGLTGLATPRLHGAFREAVADLWRAADAEEDFDLTVVDASELEVDEVIVPAPGALLSLGRLSDDEEPRGVLVLSGRFPVRSGAAFLARVAELLEAPISLMV